MKLSEYLHSKMGPSTSITWRARTVEQIEEWISEWYKKEYQREPPMWLLKGPEQTIAYSKDAER